MGVLKGYGGKLCTHTDLWSTVQRNQRFREHVIEDHIVHVGFAYIESGTLLQVCPAAQ